MSLLKISRSIFTSLAVACLLGISTLGCEEDVIPVMETDMPFTLFGLITPDLDTQWVRVFPIENRLIRATPEPIDALITSENLNTGEIREWQDSLLHEDDGKYSHVFWSAYRAKFSNSYLIHAVRSDGLTSQVEVTVPPEAEISIEDPYEAGFIWQTIIVQGDVPQLLKVEVVYEILFEQIVDIPTIGLDTILTRTKITFPIDNSSYSKGDDWEITINLMKDREILNSLIPEHFYRPTPQEIYLWDIEIRMIAASEAWDPPGGQ